MNVRALPGVSGTTPTPASPEGYTVRRGDSMWQIARDHGVSLPELVRANPQVRDPSMIVPGQVLRVPAAAPRQGVAAAVEGGAVRPRGPAPRGGAVAPNGLGPQTVRAQILGRVGAQRAPTMAQIRAGAVIERDMSGDSVRELQQRLTDLGYGVGRTGTFGPTTQGVLRDFQRDHAVQQTGRFGPTTLAALERAEARGGTRLGREIGAAAEAEALRRDTTGWCWAGVADAVESVLPGMGLWGGSAYMAADQFAADARFAERPVARNELGDLPPGAVVVWGRTAASPDGHISVALGDGREASDHIDQQRTHLRGYTNYRVFFPVD